MVNMIGGHCVGINIHECQPYPVSCHLSTKISKWRTILHTTVPYLCGYINFFSQQPLGISLKDQNNSGPPFVTCAKVCIGFFDKQQHCKCS